MGAFSNDIRQGKITGPNKREFRRSQFENAAQDPNSDDADREAAITGLYFDVLLSFIRDRPSLQTLSGSLFGPLMVAITNLSYCARLREHQVASTASAGGASMHERLALIQLPSMDQPASLDELVSALGDGVKYALMRFHSEAAVEAELLHQVSWEEMRELRVALANAIDYHVVTDYYQECRANTLTLVATDRGAALTPVDEEVE